MHDCVEVGERMEIAEVMLKATRDDDCSPIVVSVGREVGILAKDEVLSEVITVWQRRYDDQRQRCFCRKLKQHLKRS